jgi:hypothetical protein
MIISQKKLKGCPKLGVWGTKNVFLKLTISNLLEEASLGYNE